MKEVQLSMMASTREIFAIDTASQGRVTGVLIGVTDDIGGETLPSGNIAHKGIVINKKGNALCIPVSRSVYDKFLAEVKRRNIQLIARHS